MSKFTPRLLALAAIAATALPPCWAQVAPGAARARVQVQAPTERAALPPMEERRALIGRLGTRGGYLLGLDPGTARSFNSASLLDRYLPLVNELSAKTGVLVSFVPETNVKAFQRKAAAGQYPFIFVNAEIAASAASAGYLPLVRRSASVTSVVLTLASSKVQKVEDLGGRRLGVIEQSTATALARSAFVEAKVSPRLESAGAAGEEELLRAVDSQQVDGAILHEDIARASQARAPGKYRIPARLGTAPGFVLMAHPTVPASTREAARSALFDLRVGDPIGDRILKGIDGKPADTAFEVATDEDMQGLIKMFNQSAAYDRKAPPAPTAPARPGPGARPPAAAPAAPTAAAK